MHPLHGSADCVTGNGIIRSALTCTVTENCSPVANLPMESKTPVDSCILNLFVPLLLMCVREKVISAFFPSSLSSASI